MSNGINMAIIQGTLGADPDIRYTADGKPVANFSAVTKDTYKGVEQKEWHKLCAFGKTAELIEKYIRKGQQHTFIGKLQTRKWQDKSGNDRYTTEIVVREVHFGNNPRSAPKDEPKDHAPKDDFFDEEIPF